MPIKLPKGFARRKSAGNVLESFESELQSTEGSFRVLDRVEAADYGSAREQFVKKRVAGRPNSSPIRHDSNRSFDDEQQLSNLTNNSNSTGGASSSARHSYQSTEPSSLESTSQDELDLKQNPTSSPPQASFDEGFFGGSSKPQEPSKFSASLGRKRFIIARSKFSQSSRRDSEATETSRGRSHTASSYASSYASTALPPQIDLGLGTGGASGPDAGGSWFEEFGISRRSPIMEEPSSLDPPEPPRPVFRSESDSLLVAKKQFSFDMSDERPLPLSTRLEQSPPPNQYPPRSWESNVSQRGFAARNMNGAQLETRGLGLRQSSPSRGGADHQVLMDAAFASQALERQHGFAPDTSFAHRPRDTTHDSSYLYASAAAEATPRPFSNRDNWVNGSSTTTTPRAANDETSSLFEDLPASTALHKLDDGPPAIPKGNKVMTPAEFERAKQNAETTKDDDEQSEKSEDEDAYEDEDEAERVRQMAKQRRKQEAHLSVYRQQMMKVTGEQPAGLPERPTVSRFSQSLPNIPPISSLSPADGEQAGKSSDESDEDIPLGVLQAHGFPSRSRPPTRMADHPASLSRPATQLSSYPAPVGSTRNDASAGGGGSGTLPPFARNLPADPYVGASLVNQTNRESLQYNNPTVPTPSSATPLPPGGLVGVIAGEERARAMRRGSPNANGVYSPLPPQQPWQSSPSVQQQPMVHPMQNMPMQQQQFSPAEQAQMQMAQMMQMQMQWMQQMMQMQAMGQPPGTPMPPMPQMPFMGNQMLQHMQQQAQAGAQQNNFLSPLPFQNQQRPDPTATWGSGHQRAGSSMSNYTQGPPAPSAFGVMPTMSFDGVQGHYAPSIAPTERSNVGQPSRYRPVTPANANSTRTSTLSMGGGAGVAQGDFNLLSNPRARSPGNSAMEASFRNSYPSPQNPYASTEALNMTSTIRAVSRPKKGVGAGAMGGSDEDEDEGWEEMKRKREQRKSRWRPRRDTVIESQTPSHASAGLEGLYYEGPLE